MQVEAMRADGALVLAGGLQVLLAGIYPDVTAAAELNGRVIEIATLGEADRWGRRPVLGWSGTESLQESLVAGGLAVVWGGGVSAGCLKALQEAERSAQAGRKGLWALPADGSDLRFVSSAPEVLQARAGRLAIVEGRIESLGKSRDTRYLNFGRHWATDFTVTLDTSIEGQLAAAGIDLARMDGARVRVRGVVLLKNGPHIEVTHPAQIERAD